MADRETGIGDTGRFDAGMGDTDGSEARKLDSSTAVARHDVPVLVVGAGPAGLVTAIGLARLGVAALTIERHPSTSIFPRATGVSTRSMEIFRGWGIDDRVRRGGWRVTARQATVRRLDDREPREEPLGFPDEAASLAVSPTTAAVSPQDHLEPVLVEHLREVGGEVRFDTELISMDQVPDGVDVVLRDRRTGTESRLRAAYVVGADGHRSTVRSALGIAMEGPDDLGRFLSILFRADLSDVLGDRVYGLYQLEGPGGPPTIVLPSGTDDRFVLGVPLPPDMDDAAVSAAFTTDRCRAMVRAAAGRPDLPVEILATSAFAFSAQVATRMRDGRVFLVGDAAHRMTPRGGRGMNTAIADGHDLAWKLAWVLRGQAGAALLDTFEAERGPIGRRNVALSMAPGGGGTDDGLLEDLGPFDAEPGHRAPHIWLDRSDGRRSVLDLFGAGFVLLTAGDEVPWREAARRVATNQDDGQPEVQVHAIGADAADEDASFRAVYGLEPGGAVLVRPDGIVAWRSRRAPRDPAAALLAALAAATGRAATETSAAPDHRSAAAAPSRAA